MGETLILPTLTRVPPMKMYKSPQTAKLGFRKKVSRPREQKN